MARGDQRLRAANGALNQIGARVRERRHILELTQDGLCARLALTTEGQWNCDRQDVLKIEHGTRTVTDVEMLALAKALECDATWLFIGKNTNSG